MTNPLKVQVTVAHAEAIKNCKTVFGDVFVCLTAEDLEKFSPEEREELGRYSLTKDPAVIGDDQPSYIRFAVDLSSRKCCIAEATPETVRTVLAFAIAQRTKEKEEAEKRLEEEKRKAQEDLQEFLATPIEKLLSNNYCARTGSQWGSNHLCYNVYRQNHSEAKEKIAEVQKEVEKRNIQAVLAAQIREERKENEKKQAETLKQEYEQQFIDFALAGLAGDTAQRAAKESYGIKQSVVRAIIAQLPKPDGISTDKDDDYEWQTRANPSADAFELLDKLTAQVKEIKNKPACVDITVSDIMRITAPAKEYAYTNKFTGVIVTVSSPITKDSNLLYYAQTEKDEQ